VIDTREPGRVARFTDRLATRLLGLPPARTSYTRREERTPMRDGAVLLGEHYAPDTQHALGTVLVRSPYGRGALPDVTSGRAFAARGYHVLVQSCRGTYGSGGAFDPMAREADDGRDTVAWLREQDWFDGRLATYGPSYLGWTQWALMADPPPELRAAVVVVGPHDMYETVYSSGAFALDGFLSWSDLMVHQEDSGVVRGLARSATAPRRLGPVYAGLPLGAAAESALGGRAPWFADWLGTPDAADPFWGSRRVPAALEAVDVPVLLVGGWQDLFLEQTLTQYAALHRRGVEVALTVGPWTHVDVGSRAAGVVARETLGWLDRHVASLPGAERSAPVRVHVTGAGQWRDLPEWPPPTAPQVWFLGEGRLRPEPAPGAVTFTYDPADPTPGVGGRLLGFGAGVKDNRALEARPDVVTFTSAPLAADVAIMGRPIVELEHGVDNPHADVFVRLCDVDVTGRSANFSDTLVRLDPARGPGPLRVELDACAHRLRAGHRLRLLVAGGAHPRFVRNSGTGEPAATAAELKPATHTVHGGRVILPA
jgi:uncharacterized protein